VLRGHLLPIVAAMQCRELREQVYDRHFLRWHWFGLHLLRIRPEVLRNLWVFGYIRICQLQR
jgi:hypothetical protein